MTKQTTIVVIDSLRVNSQKKNILWVLISSALESTSDEYHNIFCRNTRKNKYSLVEKHALSSALTYCFTIGIKHGFPCINIRQVLREVLKTEGHGFQHLPRDLANVNGLKTYYCIKTENVCYISCCFLHYFVLPFHRCLVNVISTDYACSRAGHYTSGDGSNSVAPVQAY